MTCLTTSGLSWPSRSSKCSTHFGSLLGGSAAGQGLTPSSQPGHLCCSLALAHVPFAQRIDVPQ